MPTPKIMQNKTTSHIPKTPHEKLMWIRSRKLVSKMTGTTNENHIPWGLVTHIYKNEKSANKEIKPDDIKSAKKSKAVSRYKTNSYGR